MLTDMAISSLEDMELASSQIMTSAQSLVQEGAELLVDDGHTLDAHYEAKEVAGDRNGAFPQVLSAAPGLKLVPRVLSEAAAKPVPDEATSEEENSSEGDCAHGIQ
jgi:hypothetical protein